MGDYDLVRKGFGYTPRAPDRSSMYDAMNSFHIKAIKKKNPFWNGKNSLTRKKKSVSINT